ncbi:EKC/KEOPS complex subunit BUD32 [Porphyridium purpureum]|uniref:non-specific serine/threonine protein kinase n=1 Tax=Porphyridium purpureum TaxID=35688 RepID=A0A5J4YHK0_PORPP|nr:EKC/KEOPS complex subunit BUD32 [Porphyridium purpureum]|eukprot:POR4613..scf270_19
MASTEAKSDQDRLAVAPHAKRMRTEAGDHEQLLAQGAEGRVVVTELLGRRVVCKYRFPKAYRHAELDARLNAKRLSQEVRLMLRARQLGIRTPLIYHVDARAHAIYMELLDAAHGWMPVKALLVLFERDALALKSQQRDADQRVGDDSETRSDVDEIGTQLGSLAAVLHAGGIIHGDLTTSNVMVRRRDPTRASGGQSAGQDFEFAMIDFGLSHVCTKQGDEERAVDLYVLERAIESAHNKLAARLGRALMEAYASAWPREDAQRGARVLRRLEDVRMRGRKRDMIG